MVVTVEEVVPLDSRWLFLSGVGSKGLFLSSLSLLLGGKGGGGEGERSGASKRDGRSLVWLTVVRGSGPGWTPVTLQLVLPLLLLLVLLGGPPDIPWEVVGRVPLAKDNGGGTMWGGK